MFAPFNLVRVHWTVILTDVSAPIPALSCSGADPVGKRGGSQIRLELLESDGGTWELDQRLLAVDESLTRLQALDERAPE
jgi:hypothetical protein